MLGAGSLLRLGAASRLPPLALLVRALLARSCTPEPAGAQQSLKLLATAPSWPLPVRIQLRTCVDLPSQFYCDPIPMTVRWTSLASLTRRASPNYWDVIAFTMIVAVFVVIANGSRGMIAALPPPGAATVSLDYGNLPYYALRTVLRMFIALGFSFLFTFTYATLAAKSRRAEMVLIPILDVLQSVPVLGFLSFTVTVFTGAFPSALGPECAAIFAIFTSQAWNMAFSFYQSLRTVPRDLDEVARGFRLTPWQRFWSLEVPFAIPGLLWNTMMSMSGGWFFVVASEAISVGNTTIKLPGIGSYLALAIEERRVDAVVAAVAAMSVVILLYDQLLFRPVVAWASKFRVELSASQIVEELWVLRIFQRGRAFRFMARSVSRRLMGTAFWRMELPVTFQRREAGDSRASRIMDVVWFAAIGRDGDSGRLRRRGPIGCMK